MTWNFGFVFLFFLLESSTTINGQGCPTNDPIQIGTEINGKNYYYVPPRGEGWKRQDAKMECDKHQMALATISSVDEFNYLGKNSGGEFTGLFWTSGRDAQDVHQFSWDKTNLEPLDTFPILIAIDFQTCLLFNSQGVQSTLIPQPCSVANKRFGILCEMATAT